VSRTTWAIAEKLTRRDKSVGNQFFSACLAATPAHNTTWGALKVIYR